MRHTQVVTVVCGERDAFADLPFLELERTGAVWMAGPVPLVRFDLFLLYDVSGRERELLEEVRLGRVNRDLQRLFVDDLDTRDLFRLTTDHVPGADDVAQVLIGCR